MTEPYIAPYYEYVRAFIMGDYFSTPLYLHAILYGYFAVLFFLTFFSIYFGWRNQKKGNIDYFLITSLILFISLKTLTLYQDSFNPDEGMLISAAINLMHDPKPWVSADATTLGPLAYGILSLTAYIIKLFGGNGFITYFLARAVLTFCIISSYIMLYKLFLLKTNRLTAQLTAFLFLLYFGTSTEDMEINAYNTEYTYVLFFTLSVYGLYQLKEKQSIIFLIISGLTAGVLPYIKLQVVPMQLCLILWTYSSIFLLQWNFLISRKSTVIYAILYSIMLALPTIVFASYVASYNGLENAYFYYYENAQAHIAPLTFQFFENFFKIFYVYLAHFSSILPFSITILSIFIVLLHIKRFNIDILFSFLIVFASIFALMRPARGFPHYNIFVVIPAFILLLNSLYIICQEYNDQNSSHWKLNTILYPTLLSFSGLFFLASEPFNYIRHSITTMQQSFSYRTSTVYKNVTQTILDNTAPDDPIVVWGWAMQFHVYTNRPSATAQSNIERIWGNYPIHNIQLFINDLKRTKPKLIIDAVAPSSWMFWDEKVLALPLHKEIWNVVKDDYRLLKVIPDGHGSIKIYIREPSL